MDERDWSRLKVLARIGGYRIRDMRALGETGDGEEWLAELSEAWDHHLLEGGWETALKAGGKPRDGSGRLRAGWVRAFKDAVLRLAAAGEMSGPESDAEVWASWVAHEFVGVLKE